MGGYIRYLIYTANIHIQYECTQCTPGERTRKGSPLHRFFTWTGLFWIYSLLSHRAMEYYFGSPALKGTGLSKHWPGHSWCFSWRCGGLLVEKTRNKMHQLIYVALSLLHKRSQEYSAVLSRCILWSFGGIDVECG